MVIKKAVYEDLPGILDLQKLAYLSEAQLLNNYSIQPLTQTLQELEEEFDNHIILKLRDDSNDKIIGSVRAHEENDRVYVGKLMVHPDHQNKGFGKKLLEAIESIYENKTFELFTSGKSEKNIQLYKNIGYKEFRREKASGDLEMIFMEKGYEPDVFTRI